MVDVTSGNSTVTSKTDSTGVATFTIPAGVYALSVPTCGTAGNREVTVPAASSSSVTWTCAIP